MKPFEGKGIFLWMVPEVLNGDPVKVAYLLNNAGIEHVHIKICDGPYKYRPSIQWSLNLTTTWLIKFKEIFRGKVGGWGFNYGYDTAGEGEIAAIAMNELGLDYYIFDIESKFESQTDIVNKTINMINLYRNKCSKPVGWCTWAMWRSSLNVQWHNVALAKKAVSMCDFAMPMMYWSGQGAANATAYINKSLLQWKEITTIKPIIPAGRAYIGDNGTAEAAGITAFHQVVKSNNLLGESWWSVQHALTIPGVWDAITRLSTWGSLPPIEPPVTPVPLTDAQKFDIMWQDYLIRHPEYV